MHEFWIIGLSYLTSVHIYEKKFLNFYSHIITTAVIHLKSVQLLKSLKWLYYIETTGTLLMYKYIHLVRSDKILLRNCLELLSLDSMNFFKKHEAPLHIIIMPSLQAHDKFNLQSPDTTSTFTFTSPPTPGTTNICRLYTFYIFTSYMWERFTVCILQINVTYAHMTSSA